MPYAKPWSEEVKEKMREYSRRSQRKRLEKDPEGERIRLRDIARLRRKNVPRTEREKELARDRVRKRRAENISFKVAANLRTRLYCAVRSKQKKGSAVRDLGCSVEDFLRYMENQFEEGMTWENWTHDTWHIDHVIPLTAFDLTDPDDVKQACHFTNLRPMWARDNVAKSNKIPEDVLVRFMHRKAYPDNF